MMLTYENAVKLLQSQGKFYINLGLDRVLSVLKLLGNPQKKIKVIHIAGTNGKGSVSSILANVLKVAGYNVGLYTSPHLLEYTERIKINGVEISKSDFAKYISDVCNISDKNKINLTEFEILTVVMFKYFVDNNVDIAVIETGLGGRYDATNVCDDTLISVITSISLDHTDRFGNTYEKIAYEKAGIIKNGSKVVISAQNNGFEIVKDIAKEKKAKLVEVSTDIEMIFECGKNYAILNSKRYEFPLLGLYQKQNLALVLKTLENLDGFLIDDKAIEFGLKTSYWPARLEYKKNINLLIDGAHNPDSAMELRKSLDYYFPSQKRKFIYSTINTKDYKTIAEILFNPDDEIYYYEFNYKDAVSYIEYKNNVPFLKNIKQVSKLEISCFLKTPDLKILTGSLYMIGELYKDIN